MATIDKYDLQRGAKFRGRIPSMLPGGNPANSHNQKLVLCNLSPGFPHDGDDLSPGDFDP